MISALFYLQFHSMKNRLVMRFKRLKKPKYRVGAIVGGLYFYLYFFRFLGGSSATYGQLSGGPVKIPLPAVDPLLRESLRALLLFVVVLLAWFIPRKRAALAFTEAEVAFLFPAPVTRPGLIYFKILRSQLAVLSFSLFFTLIFSRLNTGGHWLIRAAGWWVILFTLNLHFLGAAFALTMLMDRGLSTWKRRAAVLALVATGIGVVVAWAVRTIPELRSADLKDLGTMKDYFEQLLLSGPLPYLLYPFRLVVRPYLAPNWLAFLVAVGPVLLVMLAHYFWVIRADVAFEEASVEASQKLAERIAAARAGNWRGGPRKFKSKRPPFQLRPAGSPVMAVLWKNLIDAGSAFTLRTWIILGVGVLSMSLCLHGVGAKTNWIAILALFAAMSAAVLLLLGPQIVRQDFRQDLPQADLLKVLPMRGWQIALGEVLAPAVILTGIQWLLIILGAACAMPFARDEFSPGMVLALAAGTAVLSPALNLISLIIPNAAVLWFPAWFQAGKDGPQGIEATGQRLIFALGQFLAFVAALVPAAAVGEIGRAS